MLPADDDDANYCELKIDASFFLQRWFFSSFYFYSILVVDDDDANG